MKNFNKMIQFGLILTILFISSFLQIKLNLPIPATILGMIILFVLLVTKIIKLKWVEDIAKILLDSLPLLFVPAGVGIIKELHVFKNNIISLSFILIFTTIIVILVTGYTIQILENNKRGNKR